MKLAPETIDVSIQELEWLVDGACHQTLNADQHQKLRGAVETLGQMARKLADKEATLRQLRQMLLQPGTTEKTRVVLARAGVKPDPSGPAKPAAEKKKGKGHGRNPACAFAGARKVDVAHPSLQPGDRCPECEKGKVYPLQEPAVRVRIVGQAPVQATVYEFERLRCNLCQEVYEAPPPAEMGAEKFDQTAASMVAVLKYGSGVPFYRLEGLQANLGIPLPSSTQWDMAAKAAASIAPGYEELIRQAAQGQVLYNDDTAVRILALTRETAADRTGVFTSGIVATTQGQRIALFFSGDKHAGENLADVLTRRAAELPPPIQMCDALARNVPKLSRGMEVLLANCLTHCRRNFVEVAPNFPPECRYVLETLGEIYGHDETAREQGMTADERLAYHQAESGPLMEQLRQWGEQQMAAHQVEPNSGLGKAIRYLLNHWEKLSLFLRQAGAPLDTNLVERALKKAILHRKNALFYRTRNGARVGDLFMSLIHTCELCGGNPFDYLTELQKHAAELKQNPSSWMPWNYRATLDEPAMAKAA
jgi:transposase